MKRLIAALIFIPSLVLATPSVWKSSNTATADTAKSLCGSNRAIFHGVCVNEANTGSISIYDSRGSATSPIAVMKSTSVLNSGGCHYYDVAVSSGLTYTNSTTSNITILYQCY